MIQLYIVRHGETEENAAGILQGHIEGHLSAKGIAQAQALQKEIASQIHPDRLLSSDLHRTIHTAQILNESFQLPLETSALLRERDWGEYTGLKIADLPQGAFPPSVETIRQMLQRAETFLEQLATECRRQPEVKEVLIVSHGVFSRCLLAAATHQDTIQGIPILKNLEMRQISLPSDYQALPLPAENSTDPSDTTNILRHGKEC